MDFVIITFLLSGIALLASAITGNPVKTVVQNLLGG